MSKMAHSERRGEAVAMNIYGEQDMKLFESGVATTHIREVYSKFCPLFKYNEFVYENEKIINRLRKY